MIEVMALVAIMITSGAGVAFGVLGITAWLERHYGLRLG